MNSNATDCPTCKVRANKPCRYINKPPGTRPKTPRGIKTTMHKSRIQKLARLMETLRQAWIRAGIIAN